MAIEIALMNASKVLSDDEVAKPLKALQTQVSRDFATVWGVDATLTFYAQGKAPRSGSWWLVVLDNSDQAGALGYHDLTTEGLPLGKVFAASDKQSGLQWTVTASHELLEMLVDPDINLTAFVEDPSGRGGRLYAYEVCDACEADEFGYEVNGVLVSDFVYPAWFESFRTKGATQFDKQAKIEQPFQLLKGGYIGIYDVTSGSGWQQITAQLGPRHRRVRPPVGSRRERRRTPKHDWQRSTVKLGK
jgi:hypothetical protein